ncbi:phage tail tape measure protein [Streptomyces yangpuensis]|uniref:phage tail tape measure protein n=1 Tax=Streptomyces yangpuensis TaxID=1648182 RepID=UPI0034219B0C
MPAPEIAVAYVSIVPSLQGFQQDLRQQVIGPAEDVGADAGASMGSRLRDALKAGAAAAAIAAGAVIAKGLVDAIEQAHIKKTVQAQLGATGKDAARYGKVAGKLFTSGVTDTFEEGAQAIRKVMESGILPPEASNKQLQAIATKAADVAKVFEQDLGSVTNAVSQMIKTGLAANATEAFDILTKGFQNGANKADDLLDTFNEYSTQFRKLGLDGKTALGLISQLVQAGARDSDIAADALKEFSIRAVDASDSSAEAYKALGLDAEEMTAQIAQGGKAASDGLTTVIERLKAMGDPVAREAAAVGLFGTQAEDLGEALYAMDPSKAVASLGNLADASKNVGDTIRGGPMHEIEEFTRTLKQGLVEVLGKYAIPAIAEFAGGVIALSKAAVAGFRWVADGAPWLAPFAVGIGGITLAMNANAIATGIVTGVFAAYRAVMLTGIAITNGMAIAQGLLNAVMALNPFVLIVIAIAAFVTALVVAYKKSETFRAIVDSAMRGIGAAFSWLWNTVLKPFFGFLDTAFRIWLTLVTVIVIAPIMAALRGLGALFGWLYDAAIKPAIDGIGTAAMWLWNNAIRPAWDSIGEKAKWLWNVMVKPVFTAFGLGIEVLGDAAMWLWRSAISPAFGYIGDKASWLWNSGIKPAFDLIERGADAMADSFRRGKDYIGKQWDELKGIARKPVAYVIDVVYNDGLVPLWNRVADAFGAPKLGKMTGFARGGILPGSSSWRNGDDQLVPMRRGEGVYVSEAMKDPYERARLFAVNKAAMAGQSLSRFRDSGFARGGVVGAQSGFAKGGIFGWIGNALQGAGSAAWETAKRGASWLGDTLESSARAGVSRLVNPLLDRIPGSSTLFGKAIRGVPDRMIDALFGYSKAADRKIEESGAGGAGVRAALAWARTQAGKPYQWAGAGNPSWDCSGFMAGIQKKITGQNPNGRLWSTFAFNGSTAPAGWVRGMKAPFMVGITNAGVGHTAGTLGNVNVESRGGAGVVVGNSARGYRDALFTDWYGFEPSKKYDNGGWLQPGATAAVNKTGKPEPILTASQWSNVATLANRGASGGLQPGDRLILSTGAGADFEVYIDQRANQRIHDELTGPAGLGRRL